MIDIRLGPMPIDVGAELAMLQSGTGKSSAGQSGGTQPCGAVASFTGIVRADDDGQNAVTAIELEHYPAMTQAALQAIAQAAVARWDLSACTIVHRIGMIDVGETVVFTGAASSHRASALSACAYLIDRLKSDAPFWKKEYRSNGDAQWVAAKASDVTRAEHWDQD